MSVHVPKCAGTSFRHVIDALYRDRIWYNYGAVFCREQARIELVPKGTELIHGHFIADAFDDLFPDARLVTWVRDPVERVVSNYHHYLRSPDPRDDCCRLLHDQGLSLMEFAELDWMRNLTVRYLAGKAPEAFAFVGIAERFDECLGRFLEQFGLPETELRPRVNVNPGRGSGYYPLRPAERSHIRALNAADAAWYRHAVRRHADQARVPAERTA